MPEICRFYGIIIHMYFNEHNPPHFHATYQGFKASITIEDGVVNGQMPSRALRLIFEWLAIHEAELLNNWNSMRETGDFKTIAPLK